MTRKILHLLGTAQAEGASIAEIVQTLALGLNPQKYSVEAWFMGPEGPLADRLRAAGISVQCVRWQGGAKDPLGAMRFWQQLGRGRFALVHQHFGARAARTFIRLKTSTPVIVHVHGALKSIPAAVHGAHRVIAVSHATARSMAAFHPTVIHTGIGVHSQPAPAQPLPSEELVIGTACRLIPMKGLTFLLQAFAEIAQRHPAARLEIAGSGPERERLEREARHLHLSDRVTFTGWVEDLHPLLARWHVFVLPSLDEGLPITILQAMAAGLPVIASAIGGIPELVKNDETGVLVPPQDVPALARALHRLVENPEVRGAMGQAGRARVMSEFSAPAMVGKIEALYDDLISNPEPSCLPHGRNTDENDRRSGNSSLIRP